MSVEIWPPTPLGALKAAGAAAQERELKWLLNELHDTLANLKHGLEDCYALLAPIDPGSTLVVSTPRNEAVKGHVTRVGTRITKGSMALRMRTVPHQTLSINVQRPIHLGPLTNLHTLLTHSIDLVTLTLSHTVYAKPEVSVQSGKLRNNQSSYSQAGNAVFIAAQLRLLSQSLSEASAVLRGPPLTDADPTWTYRSVAPSHFDPPLPPNVSFHLGMQDSQLVLWLRALEPADAPVNLGMKFALAIGTARRLEHDEADQTFSYCPEGESGNGNKGGAGAGSMQVYVREKVRVESADPSLLSLSSKLTALSHTLALARRNVAAVMGEEPDE